MNTLIIYISDIHFTGTRQENEGVVINAFLKDVKKQLGEMPPDFVTQKTRIF